MKATASTALSRREFLVASAASALLGARPHRAECAKREQSWEIGCYTRPFDKFDWQTAFDGVAAAGYKFIGLMTTKNGAMLQDSTSLEQCAKYAAAARERGLTIVSAYGTFSAANSVAEGVRELQGLIDRCAAVASPSLLLGGTGAKEQANYYRAVAESTAYAAQKKVGLTIKPHGGTNATGPQCRSLIEQVGHSNFRLWYDPGNIFYYSDGKLDPVDDAATVTGLVVGMSVKDFLPPKDVLVTPGTGRVRFAEVFSKLRAGGFQTGPLVVECVKPGDLPAIIAEARKARLFVERLVDS